MSWWWIPVGYLAACLLILAVLWVLAVRAPVQPDDYDA
jgi:hypothetical protein